MLDIRYVAGFFDGEGCIQLCYSGMSRATSVLASVHLMIQVSNNDKPILDRIQGWLGGRVVARTMAKKKPQHKQCYYLVISGRKAAQFLNVLLPYLHVKRKQAEAAILFSETLHGPWKELGKAGRPISSEGLHLRKIAFLGFREAMDAAGGRGLSWAI